VEFYGIRTILVFTDFKFAGIALEEISKNQFNAVGHIMTPGASALRLVEEVSGRGLVFVPQHPVKETRKRLENAMFILVTDPVPLLTLLEQLTELCTVSVSSGMECHRTIEMAVSRVIPSVTIPTRLQNHTKKWFYMLPHVLQTSFIFQRIQATPLQFWPLTTRDLDLPVTLLL